MGETTIYIIYIVLKLWGGMRRPYGGIMGVEKKVGVRTMSQCYRTPGGNDILLQKGPPLSLWGSPHTPTRFALPTTRGKMSLSMPETGERERNYLFKSYTDRT